MISFMAQMEQSNAKVTAAGFFDVNKKLIPQVGRRY